MDNNNNNNQEQTLIKKKRYRRCTKQDETPRAYKCGCGKGYYSYPALYTHLKLKHEGIPPRDTQIPMDKHYGGRGRPKEKNMEVEPDIFVDEEKRDDQKQQTEQESKEEK